MFASLAFTVRTSPEETEATTVVAMVMMIVMMV